METSAYTGNHSRQPVIQNVPVREVQVREHCIGEQAAVAVQDVVRLIDGVMDYTDLVQQYMTVAQAHSAVHTQFA